MSDHTERTFEDELCGHLAAHGWLYSFNSTGYDPQRALFPADILGWLQDIQPDQYAKVVKTGTPAERDQLLDRIVKVLDAPFDSGGGTLNLLRNGFKLVAARFDMCQFAPETGLNETTVARYQAVRVRVMRQVYYSMANRRSIDLVLFVNGLPVATLELKTDFTQSVSEAIEQYRRTRLPNDPATKRAEPLFGFGCRALVHFAVSNDEVWMTTRLAGEKTRFLPFNVGVDGGAGNPLNPGGSASSYLWERILQRDAWLTILGKFLHVETKSEHDPISGALSRSTTLLFPRYHQWEVVTQLAETARAEGAGNRYLVQHSAGSGKTNSIAWTAHRLARLHDANDAKVFDSVLVVTDRTVLDDQLQAAIRQIDSAQDVVATIGDDDVRRSATGSKSGLLARSLLDGRLIIVVTIQTFPHAMQTIRETEGLAHRRFAVIADEAHSSQTGATANQLKQVLTAEELADIEDGGEVDVEAVLAADATARASSTNISYFAFTATPKAKTLELFGRPDSGGMPAPFHVYTMKQAIDEEYILDVLPGYQTFDTAFQIAQRVSGGRITAARSGEEPQGDMELVDESTAVKGLMRWVKLHPTNIAQKVQIIVEHFRVNVAHLLDGHAKAMVVTDSRKAAVRYKLAMDAYIAKMKYPDLATLVAFSGSVEDEESGPNPFTESSMNPGLRGRDLATAFKTPEYQIMLVANKFQTGFDQPLLCAMYVDKRLAGVTAVQTLSRLNRMYRAPGGEKKTAPMVLDFVNDSQEIRSSFEPYYTDAYLETRTDPNLVHDIATRLDQANIFTEPEIDRAAQVAVKKLGNSALTAAMGPAKQRFQTRYQSALADHNGAGDKTALDELDLFRKNVSTFVRLYDFMSQIVDYEDTALEKRSIFLRLLENLIRPDNYSAGIDLSDVTLVGVKQNATGMHDLGLGTRTGLHGTTEAGSGVKQDPKMVAFAEVIERLNDLFSDEDFTSSQKETFLEGLLRTLLEDARLVTQARVNSRTQFLDSPDLDDAVVGAVSDNQGSHNRMADVIFTEGHQRDELVNLIGALVHVHAHETAGA